MKRLRQIFAVVAVCVAVASCDFAYRILHGDEMVARMGSNILLKSQLADFLPAGLSSEDSLRLTRQYINSWAVEQLFMNVADEKLSKSQKDVSKELEEYRRSLIRFRYEQHYINDRLDTLVTVNEIEEFYKDHSEMFVLKFPLVKARFLDIMKESPSYETLRKKMSSQDYDDLMAADSIAYKSALRYEDHSDEWVDMRRYARLFDVDYTVLLKALKPEGFIDIEDDKGDLKIGYVTDIRRVGEMEPLEYCTARIKDIIISNRKHVLLHTLEQDLLDDALGNNELIIY